jgi:di- and tripeptidase
MSGCPQWIDLPPAFHLEEHSQPMSSLTRPGLLSTSQQPSGSPPIHRLPNKFFDSITLSDRPRSHLSRNTSKTHSVSGGSLPGLMDDADPGPGSLPVDIQYEDKNVAHYAHFGYVYCLLLAKSNDQHVLLSGSGDSSLKLWTMTPRALSPVATLKSLDDTAGVLTVAVSDSTAFAGYQGGIIKVRA